MEITPSFDRVLRGRSAQVVGVGRHSLTSSPQAVHFDPQRRAASPELQAAIKALVAFLKRREADLGLRQRARTDMARRGFAESVEAIACNLAGLLILAPERPLAVPRSSGMMWSKSRYRSPVYGQHFRDALDLMAHPDVALIADVTRGYKFAGSTAQRSTVRPTAAFPEHVPAHLSWDAFTRREHAEVLILKGCKDRRTGEAALIDYHDTALTRRRRKEVERINAFLCRAPLIITTAHSGITEDGQPVDPTRRTVRRIFNNASWQKGGRLYGAFWETMPREDRFRLLSIRTAAHPKGERIANVDYGQLFPRLAYLEANLTPPEGDLYDVRGNGSHREGWKRLVNVLLLATAPLGNWPEGLPAAFPRGTKLRDAIAAIEQRHAPIAHLFGTGWGFKAMLLESEMLIEVLLRLHGQGVPALPLHDSVLVAVSEVGLAEEAMRAAFEHWTGGARAVVKTAFA